MKNDSGEIEIFNPDGRYRGTPVVNPTDAEWREAMQLCYGDEYEGTGRNSRTPRG
jgi:hypothetical protein